MRKVYVVCVSNLVTGGPKTLHQLADKINSIGAMEAYMVYDKKQKQETPEEYKKYNLKFAKEIEDDAENILIVPEVRTCVLNKYKNIKKIIWWLSLDFYLQQTVSLRMQLYRNSKEYNPFIYPLYHLKLTFDPIIKKKYRFEKQEPEIFHFYNCHYELQYLLDHGVKKENTEYFCGPISNVFFQQPKIDKEDIVVYNPVKGYEYTSQIIKWFEEHNHNIKFVPLKNMTAEEVRNTLQRAKVYTDFGYFPGPERIPREAVTLGCNIITSRTGAAGNDIDVPIDGKYKIDLQAFDVKEACEKILNVMNNYDENYHAFDKYREKVSDQRKIFEENINKHFGGDK